MQFDILSRVTTNTKLKREMRCTQDSTIICAMRLHLHSVSELVGRFETLRFSQRSLTFLILVLVLRCKGDIQSPVTPQAYVFSLSPLDPEDAKESGIRKILSQQFCTSPDMYTLPIFASVLILGIYI